MPLHDWISYLPGVPVFFIVSGCLVSGSVERATSLHEYLRNRLLRIYPGLWACFAVSVVFLGVIGVRTSGSAFAVWAAAQLTIAQFYNPDFLRGVGVGVINGSLWSIPVELQFYFALPVLAALARRDPRRWLAIAALAAFAQFALLAIDPSTRIGKLVGVSLFPYLVYFMIGVLYRHVHAARPLLLTGTAGAWALAYCAWVILERALSLPGQTGNLLSLPSAVLLGGVVVSCAYSGPSLAGRLLRGNDVSYGVYVYHMPVVNALLVAGISGWRGLVLTLPITALLAWASWVAVERPMLARKRRVLRTASTAVTEHAA